MALVGDLVPEGTTLVSPGLWPNCIIKKHFETGLLLSQSLSFMAYKTYTTAIFKYFVLKLYQNKNLRSSF